MSEKRRPADSAGQEDLSFRTIFKRSFGEYKHLRTLVLAASFIAVQLVLNLFRITITPELRISMGFLGGSMIGMLFGPSVSVFTAAIGDILGYFLKPEGGYFFGFTVTAMAGGLISGLVLYKKKPNLWRCVLDRGLVAILCNMALNSLWLSIISGKAIWVLLPARIVKNLVMWPIEAVLLMLVGMIVYRVNKRMSAQSR
ncbi:MAG: folate family ECF transporter S component [Christensenellales bacterium]